MMAEAAVEDRPPQKFYCHMCNIQFQNASADFTCPHCSDGFIEELQDTPESNDDIMDVEDWEDAEVVDNLMNTLPLNLTEDRRTRTRSEGINRPGRRYANRARIVRPRSERVTFLLFQAVLFYFYRFFYCFHWFFLSVFFLWVFLVIWIFLVVYRTLTRIASSNLRQHVPFENLLQDFIVNLGVGVNFGTAQGNMQLFLGNPGDYAWGREGLDAIVTQLLNQMDSTGKYWSSASFQGVFQVTVFVGPPPVSKEVIDGLPIVEVTEEQVTAKLQCSVCWEDFQLCENVRQLPCLHIYHEPCIRPWLELHGTCPICRQNLINDQSSSDNNQDPGGSSSNNGGEF
ncbi:E3 ubiquitin-protein ligase Iruka isoform X2 [Diorhabda carinulata]|uniref:E3 ubiquitin-protein ligase Iruka isoform X2 n=1 Tax=Diorhabda carinulata TaxID=1163345 RepID=UPI0025A03575|nr:E3 ubiquitin-protein ligase Iruka isoform X2 [Diorhabda carinulata]